MSKTSNNQSSSYRKQKATAADLSLLEKLDTVPAVLSVGPLPPPLSLSRGFSNLSELESNEN
jgi:hypothetical protein